MSTSELEANSSSLHQALVVVEKAEGITANDCRMLLDGRTLYMTSKILRHVHSHRPGQARKQRYKLRPWPERMHLLVLTSRKAIEGWVREAEKYEQRQRRVKRVRKVALAIGKNAVAAKRAEEMDMAAVVQKEIDVIGISRMVEEVELERQVGEAAEREVAEGSEGAAARESELDMGDEGSARAQGVAGASAAGEGTGTGMAGAETSAERDGRSSARSSQRSTFDLDAAGAESKQEGSPSGRRSSSLRNTFDSDANQTLGTLDSNGHVHEEGGKYPPGYPYAKAHTLRRNEDEDEDEDANDPRRSTDFDDLEDPMDRYLRLIAGGGK